MGRNALRSLEGRVLFRYKWRFCCRDWFIICFELCGIDCKLLIIMIVFHTLEVIGNVYCSDRRKYLFVDSINIFTDL